MSASPAGWSEVELGEVWHESRARARPGAIAPTDYIGLEHVEGGTNRITGAGRSDGVKSTVAIFSSGDILYGRLRPYLNKVIRPSFAGVASTEFLVFKETQALANALLMHLLSSSDLVAYASANSAGVNLPRISAKRLAEYRFRLAPLPEQHRIVAKIESLFARLDEGVAALKRAQANLERYRASVLKAAVEGRLTERWRRENPPEETGEELLGRILAERRKRWEAEQLAKFEAKGRNPPRNWKVKYKEPVAPDTNELPGLPEGWCWVTLPQLGDFGRGKSKHRPRGDAMLYGGDFPFIQTGEVTCASGWIRHHSKTYNHLGLSQSRLWPKGTLCITIAANIAETGILAYPACFPDSVVGLVTARPTLTMFLDYFMRTARSDLTRYAPATAQKNINLATLSKLAVPLPPAVEQERIVKLLERLVTVQETTVGTVTRTFGPVAQHLRQSILKRAFEGRLVPQDPADEPACVLLERIQAEREAERKRRKRRPTRPKRRPASRVP